MVDVTSLFEENLKMLLGLIDDHSSIAEDLIDVFIREKNMALLEAILDRVDIDQEEKAKMIALGALRYGDKDKFETYYKSLQPRGRISVAAEAINELMAPENELLEIAKNSFLGLKKIDPNDMDLVHDLAIIFSFLGDYTRARFLTNAFCGLAEARSRLLKGNILGMLDEVECLNLLFYLGDKKRGLDAYERLIRKIEGLENKNTIVLSLCNVLTRHKYFQKSLKLAETLKRDIDKASCYGIIIERANMFGKELVLEDAIDHARLNITTPIARMILSLILRKLGRNEWQELFYSSIPDIYPERELDLLVDFIETAADEEFEDMIREILANEQLKYMNVADRKDTTALKYGYGLVSVGKINKGFAVFDAYANEHFSRGNESAFKEFTLYYSKAVLRAMRKYPEILSQAEFNIKLRDKLYAIKKEFKLPEELQSMLDSITDEEYKIQAIKGIIEVELYKSKCVAAKRLERAFLVPTTLIDSLLINVAKHLIQERNYVDAISCLDKIVDTKEKFDALLSVTHRLALLMDREALPSLLKRVITIKNTAKGLDVGPVEEAKIRADLAIIFKFSGKEDVSNDSLREALEMIKEIKPTDKFDYKYYRKLSEVYGYLASTFYILGRPESDSLLNKALEYLNYLPPQSRMPIIIKLITWLTLAGWLPVVFRLLQNKSLKPLSKLVATILAERYVSQGTIEDLITELDMLLPKEEDKIDILLSAARFFARRGKRDEAEKLVQDVIKNIEKFDELTKQQLKLKIAEVYVLIGKFEEAEKLLEEATKFLEETQDTKLKDEIAAMIIPIKYMLLERISAR